MGLNIIIVAFTVIISIMAFGNVELFNNLKFNAWLVKHKKQGYRFLSHALIHGGWLHLIINMYVLFSFGRIVETAFVGLFGYKGFLYYGLLYIGGVLFSTLYDFGKHKDNPYYNAVGASGAVSAVVFASILVHPSMSLFVFPIPFALPSWVFGILYLGYSAYMGKKSVDNIGHNAHFWGSVFGIIYTIILVPGVIGNFIENVF